MRKRLLILGTLLSVFAITGCAGGSSSSSTKESGESSSGNNLATTSSGQTSSVFSVISEEKEEYSIIIRASTGVTITADKEKAKQGEIVTLTAVVESGYTLKSVKMNGDLCTSNGNNVYTFTMPEGAAVITAQVKVEGDVTIQGDIAAKLELDEETGIYSAKGITVNELSYFSFYFQGEKLGLHTVNYHKCSADLDSVFSTSSETLSIAGNAKYDFFYDPSSSMPCYVRRSEVLTAPNSVSTFESLFAGSVRSENTQWPEDLKHVTYSNTETGDEYEWTNYETGSLGVSHQDEHTYYDYRYLSGDTYKVVDTYVESSLDTTRRDDTVAYSAQYDIVGEVESGMNLYQKVLDDTVYNDNSYTTKTGANFEAHHNSHDIESLDFDIHYGYRTGFDSTFDSTLASFNVEVSSVTNDDGSFTTTIESYKNYDESLDSTSGSTTKVRYEYNIVFTFRKDGLPLNGTYRETTFDESAYNFTTNTFNAGGESLGKVVKSMAFTYEYGETISSEIDFDASPYFINQIDDISIRNSTSASQEGNVIECNDVLYPNLTTGEVSDTKSYLTMSYTPSTALDEWQYGITASSDESIVGLKSGRSNTYVALIEGNVNLTVSNHTINSGVTVSVPVIVENAYLVDGFYLTGVDPDDESNTNYMGDDEVFSNYVYLNAGTKKRAHVHATSRNTGKYANSFYTEFTAVSGNTSLLSVSMDNEKGIITFDASSASVTETTTVRVKLTAPNLETSTDEFGVETPVELIITVYINPYQLPSSPLLGEFNDLADEPEDPVILTLNQYVEGDSSTLSTLSLDGNTYSFQYTYDTETGKMTVKSSGDLGYIALTYDYENDQVGVFAEAEGSWAGQDDVTEGEALLGEATVDDEGYYEITKYYFLDRAA